MRKRSKAFLKHFEMQMGLSNRTEKIWFWCGFALLLGYLEIVLLCQSIDLDRDNPVFLAVQAIVAIPLCFLGVWLCGRLKLSQGPERPLGKKALAFCGGVFLISFLIFFLAQVTHWPGAFSSDSIVQYEQVLKGQYNNWHPVMHTWLFFWIPLKLFHGQPYGIILMQIIGFCAALAYLYSVLYRRGCPWPFMVLSWIYITANLNTIYILLFPWKDSAESIFALVLFTYLIQVYATKGEWLKKWYHLAAFSLVAFLANGMRHNAILLVASIILILFSFLKNIRRSLLICTAALLVGTWIWSGPVMALGKVEEPGKRVVETVGLPMTVLSHVYMYDRDVMSDDAKAFMSSLATEEQWESNYEDGDFNSIKWISPDTLELVNQAGYQTILRYTLEAIRSAPRTAAEGFIALTALVYGFDGPDGYLIIPYIADSNLISGLEKPLMANLESTYRLVCEYTPVKYLFCYIGIVILLLLFMAVGKLGNGNLSKVFMVLAPMAYNFGTMLLLSGSDFRFFHFNFVIIVPLLFIILMREGCANGEKTA